MRQTLYKKSKNGKIQQWEIEVSESSFRTTEGYIDGVKSTTAWTQCVEKNVGRANSTTGEEQAMKEAEARIKKQKDKGWVESVELLDTQTLTIKPMLAHKWEDYKDWMLTQTVIACQPKLDGIRCIATKQGLFTRNGKPIVAAPHIWEEIKKVLEGCPDYIKLDGELYNHNLKEDFNTITSIVRKQKVSEEDMQRAQNLLEYHIYDIDVPNQVFASRYSILDKLISPRQDFNYLKVVETCFLKPDREGNLQYLDQLYAEYLANGYEGQMIRGANHNYENNRAKCLLKRKEFEEAEFTIVDIEEGLGNRSGMMGRIKFEGFDSNARGTHEFFKELLINKHLYIGKKATVRYQNLTPDGIPRFPVMIAIRDYE